MDKNQFAPQFIFFAKKFAVEISSPLSSYIGPQSEEIKFVNFNSE